MTGERQKAASPLKPPHTVNHTIHEEFLDRSHRRADCSNPVPEVLECVRVFSWEDDVLGKEAVPERVETDDGFALRRLWSRGVRAFEELRQLQDRRRKRPSSPILHAVTVTAGDTE